MEKLIKTLALNVACIVFGTLFLILFFMSHAISRWVFLIIFLAILVIWIAGNFLLFRKKTSTLVDSSQLINIADYEQALENMDPKCFGRQIEKALKQTERLEQKRNMISDALHKYFGGSEISYNKYMGTVDNVTKVYLDNLQKMMNRIAIFDYDGYRNLVDAHQENTDAFIPYQESLDAVNSYLQDNETILGSLDDLLLEIAKLNESDKSLEDMSAMKEIEELIGQTKLYKR